MDFDNISQRILALPIPARDYVALAAGKANMLFVAERSADAGPGPDGATLHKFDLEKRKLDKVLDKINAFELSANGEKMLYRQEQNWFIDVGFSASEAGRGQAED